jgi:hypothetical protein
MKKERRTNIDWSKYIVTKTETSECLIHYIAKPDTRCGAVKFINTQGILAVTGDYGNWIFCREFHPSHDGFVSDHYWIEKLRIASTQVPTDFDAKGTIEEIEHQLAELEKDADDDRQYYNDLIDHLQMEDGEERYMVYAYDNLPKGKDSEFMPPCKKLNPWLECIFDAFDEICTREVAEPQIGDAR